jgi:hypothetical protein
LWGSTPITTFMSTHPRFGGTSAIVGAGEGHSYYFVLCTYLFRVSEHAAFSTAGGKPRTSQPTSWATGSSRAIPV